PDAAEALGDELVLRSRIARLVPPAPRNLVQVLGERLREAVGEGLRHDRAIVVVLGLEPGRELVEAVPGGDRECTEMVAGRGDEVGEAAVRSRVAVRGLLAEEAEARLVVIMDNDIVAVGRRRPEAVDASRGKELPVDDLVEQLLGVVPQLARGRLLEDRGELALQLPRIEEELPVDVFAKRFERRLDEPHTGELRRRKLVEGDALAVLLRV